MIQFEKDSFYFVSVENQSHVNLIVRPSQLFLDPSMIVLCTENVTGGQLVEEAFLHR